MIKVSLFNRSYYLGYIPLNEDDFIKWKKRILVYESLAFLFDQSSFFKYYSFNSKKYIYCFYFYRSPKNTYPYCAFYKHDLEWLKNMDELERTK